MKLATLRNPDGTTEAVRVDGAIAMRLGAPDVGALLAQPDWRNTAEAAGGASVDLGSAAYAPVVPRPGKVVCVGLNYRGHIIEMGRDLPQFPTLFSKYAETLIGAHDDIQRPVETDEFDWECELAIIMGAPVRRATTAEAEAAIAGFATLNDITARDWQFRTKEWLQGKTFEGTTPLGPVLVTPDELAGGVRPALTMTATLDGETVQKADTSDLVFDPVALVRYASTILTLQPGDVIATGTPGGVGHARTPPRYLTDGAVLVTEIDGIGRLENTARTV